MLKKQRICRQTVGDMERCNIGIRSRRMCGGVGGVIALWPFKWLVIILCKRAETQINAISLTQNTHITCATFSGYHGYSCSVSILARLQKLKFSQTLDIFETFENRLCLKGFKLKGVHVNMFDFDCNAYKLLKSHKMCILSVLNHPSKPPQRRDTGKEVYCWVTTRTTGSLMQANSQRIGGSTEWQQDPVTPITSRQTFLTSLKQRPAAVHNTALRKYINSPHTHTHTHKHREVQRKRNFLIFLTKCVCVCVCTPMLRKLLTVLYLNNI